MIYNVITRASYTIQIIEDIAIYKAELFSSAGNIFQPADKQTELTIRVFKSFDDITDNFTDIKWKRFSFNSGDYIEDKTWGDKFDNQKTITVTKNDINEKVKIQCEVYDTIKEERKLVAIESITIIDVNDMQPSDIPPENPTHGQIWIDSSVTPPIIKMWDELKQQWISIGTADPIVRNIIRNSNFFTYNINLWNKINLTDNNWGIIRGSDNNYLRLKSDNLIDDYVGIKQIISNNNIKQNSKYTFQCIAKNHNESNIHQTGMRVTIVSINENDISTIIKEEIIKLDNINLMVKHMNFETLSDTKSIEVHITGRRNKLFDFIVSKIMVANTDRLTPWELAPEDVMDAINGKFNHEDIFNALTDNGKMQGIYTNTNTAGTKDFYINASYIKSGTLEGRYIKGNGLVVTRIEDKIETLNITENGDVILRPKTFELVSGSISNVPTKDEQEKSFLIAELSNLEKEKEDVLSQVLAIKQSVEINDTSELLQLEKDEINYVNSYNLLVEAIKNYIN